jgi:hypothetical protein
MSKRQGLSLMETVLAGSLLGVVLLLLVQLLSPALRIWLQTQVLADARTMGNIAHNRMFAELRASVESSLRVTGTTCSFLSMGQNAAFDPVSGRGLWREVVLYHLQGQNIIRKTWRSGQAPLLPHVLPTTSPFALTSAQQTSVIASPSGNPRKVCTSVTNLSLVEDADGRWTLTLDTKAQTQKKLVTFRRRSTVAFRND